MMPIVRVGSRTSPASSTMHQPSIQMTPARTNAE
jgi:hypothetical protein